LFGRLLGKSIVQTAPCTRRWPPAAVWIGFYDTKTPGTVDRRPASTSAPKHPAGRPGRIRSFDYKIT